MQRFPLSATAACLSVALLTSLFAGGCAVPGYIAMAGYEATRLPGLKARSRIFVGERYEVVGPTCLDEPSKGRFSLGGFNPLPGPNSYEGYLKNPSYWRKVFGTISATDQRFQIRIVKIKRSFDSAEANLVFEAVVEDGPFKGKTVDISELLSSDGLGPDDRKLIVVRPEGVEEQAQ